MPAVITLTIWKARGLGNVPLFSLGGQHLAAGSGSVATIGGVDLGKYVHLDWGHWKTEMDQLREFFWSSRLAQWAPIAGVIAVARRSSHNAALLAGWLAAFVVVKGFSPAASIESGSFWRLLMPAWPAYLLLFAAIPLLVPTLAGRLGWRAAAPAVKPTGRRTLGVAAALLVAVPLVVVLALRPLGPQEAVPRVIQQVDGNILLTVADAGIKVDVAGKDGRACSPGTHRTTARPSSTASTAPATPAATRAARTAAGPVAAS